MSIETHIEEALQSTEKMFESYSTWGSRLQYGDTQFWAYNELFEFVNLRLETADTCVRLIRDERIGDALGLARSILEHYLLLMLLCRGHKYFQIEDRSNLTDAQFKEYLAQRQADIAAELAKGNDRLLGVEKYPRAKRRLMYIKSGLQSSDLESMVTLPFHYFLFQDFRPEEMRFDPGNYADYWPTPPEYQTTFDEHREHATYAYRRYLSYDSLLQCLELNDITDAGSTARIEAHYTFLGKFLHPTHNAVRDLHEENNFHDGEPRVGLKQNYAKSAKLLASAYVVHLTSCVTREIARLIDHAEPSYISSSGTEEIHAAGQNAVEKVPYFWFIFNDPPLYDKYMYCVHHVDESERHGIGNFSNIPNERVTFDYNIYSRFTKALSGWQNAAWGIYRSPIS